MSGKTGCTLCCMVRRSSDSSCEGGNNHSTSRNGKHVSSKVGRPVGEYRIDWGTRLSNLPRQRGEDIVILLGGGTKRRQQVDIERARMLWTEYKARTGSGNESEKETVRHYFDS